MRFKSVSTGVTALSMAMSLPLLAHAATAFLDKDPHPVYLECARGAAAYTFSTRATGIATEVKFFKKSSPTDPCDVGSGSPGPGETQLTRRTNSFSKGTNKIRRYANDGSGAVEDCFSIVVRDKTPPSLWLDRNSTFRAMTVECVGPNGTPRGAACSLADSTCYEGRVTSGFVKLDEPFAEDLCTTINTSATPSPVYYLIPPGPPPAVNAYFPLGTTTIAARASDGENVSARAQIAVHVVDTTPPVFTATPPSEVWVKGNANCKVNATDAANNGIAVMLPKPAAEDVCSATSDLRYAWNFSAGSPAQSVTRQIDWAAGRVCLPTGIDTTVKIFAVDSHNNRVSDANAKSVVYKVRAAADNSAGVLTPAPTYENPPAGFTNVKTAGANVVITATTANSATWYYEAGGKTGTTVPSDLTTTATTFRVTFSNEGVYCPVVIGAREAGGTERTDSSRCFAIDKTKPTVVAWEGLSTIASENVFSPQSVLPIRLTLRDTGSYASGIKNVTITVDPTSSSPTIVHGQNTPECVNTTSSNSVEVCPAELIVTRCSETSGNICKATTGLDLAKFPNSSDSQHTLRVVVTDVAGNSETVNYTITFNPPEDSFGGAIDTIISRIANLPVVLSAIEYVDAAKAELTATKAVVEESPGTAFQFMYRAALSLERAAASGWQTAPIVAALAQLAVRISDSLVYATERELQDRGLYDDPWAFLHNIDHQPADPAEWYLKRTFLTGANATERESKDHFIYASQIIATAANRLNAAKNSLAAGTLQKSTDAISKAMQAHETVAVLFTDSIYRKYFSGADATALTVTPSQGTTPVEQSYFKNGDIDYMGEVAMRTVLAQILRFLNVIGPPQGGTRVPILGFDAVTVTNLQEVLGDLQTVLNTVETLRATLSGSGQTQLTNKQIVTDIYLALFKAITKLDRVSGSIIYTSHWKAGLMLAMAQVTNFSLYWGPTSVLCRLTSENCNTPNDDLQGVQVLRLNDGALPPGTSIKNTLDFLVQKVECRIYAANKELARGLAGRAATTMVNSGCLFVDLFNRFYAGRYTGQEANFPALLSNGVPEAPIDDAQTSYGCTDASYNATETEAVTDCPGTPVSPPAGACNPGDTATLYCGCGRSGQSAESLFSWCPCTKAMVCVDDVWTCDTPDAAKAGNDVTCDREDNDCDGLIDEDAATLTCGEGVCAETTRCTDTTDEQSGHYNTLGQVVKCMPVARAAVELCDRVDNDCDGRVDEGLDPDQDGYGCTYGSDGCEQCQNPAVWASSTYVDNGQTISDPDGRQCQAKLCRCDWVDSSCGEQGPTVPGPGHIVDGERCSDNAEEWCYKGTTTRCASIVVVSGVTRCSLYPEQLQNALIRCDDADPRTLHCVPADRVEGCPIGTRLPGPGDYACVKGTNPPVPCRLLANGRCSILPPSAPVPINCPTVTGVTIPTGAVCYTSGVCANGTSPCVGDTDTPCTRIGSTTYCYVAPPNGTNPTVPCPAGLPVGAQCYASQPGCSASACSIAGATPSLPCTYISATQCYVVPAAEVCPAGVLPGNTCYRGVPCTASSGYCVPGTSRGCTVIEGTTPALCREPTIPVECATPPPPPSGAQCWMGIPCDRATCIPGTSLPCTPLEGTTPPQCYLVPAPVDCDSSKAPSLSTCYEPVPCNARSGMCVPGTNRPCTLLPGTSPAQCFVAACPLKNPPLPTDAECYPSEICDVGKAGVCLPGTELPCTAIAGTDPAQCYVRPDPVPCEGAGLEGKTCYISAPCPAVDGVTPAGVCVPGTDKPCTAIAGTDPPQCSVNGPTIVPCPAGVSAGKACYIANCSAGSCTVAGSDPAKACTSITGSSPPACFVDPGAPPALTPTVLCLPTQSETRWCVGAGNAAPCTDLNSATASIDRQLCIRPTGAAVGTTRCTPVGPDGQCLWLPLGNNPLFDCDLNPSTVERCIIGRECQPDNAAYLCAPRSRSAETANGSTYCVPYYSVVPSRRPDNRCEPWPLPQPPPVVTVPPSPESGTATLGLVSCDTSNPEAPHTCVTAYEACATMLGRTCVKGLRPERVCLPNSNPEIKTCSLVDIGSGSGQIAAAPYNGSYANGTCLAATSVDSCNPSEGQVRCVPKLPGNDLVDPLRCTLQNGQAGCCLLLPPEISFVQCTPDSTSTRCVPYVATRPCDPATGDIRCLTVPGGGLLRCTLVVSGCTDCVCQIKEGGTILPPVTGVRETCNGLDDNGNGYVDEEIPLNDLTNACQICPATACKEKSLFNLAGATVTAANASGVKKFSDNSIGINPDAGFAYFYVAGGPWVSKIETSTGREVGRYCTAIGRWQTPAQFANDAQYTANKRGAFGLSYVNMGAGGCGGLSASRTAVDQYGNVYVGDRSADTVTKVLNSDLGACTDRNRDGLKTSVDKNRNGIIDVGLTGADQEYFGDADDCIAWTSQGRFVINPNHLNNDQLYAAIPQAPCFLAGSATTQSACLGTDNVWAPMCTWTGSTCSRLDNTEAFDGVRSLAIDRTGFLWAAMCEGRQDVVRLDVRDGYVVQQPQRDASGSISSYVKRALLARCAYGAVVDRSGLLWITTGCCGQNPIMAVNTSDQNITLKSRIPHNGPIVDVSIKPMEARHITTTPCGSYGIALDDYGKTSNQLARVWSAQYSCPRSSVVARYNPNTGDWDLPSTTYGIDAVNPRGITVQSINDNAAVKYRVWVAGDLSHLLAFDTTNDSGNITLNSVQSRQLPAGTAPIGIGIGSTGAEKRVILSNHNSMNVTIYDPTERTMKQYPTGGNLGVNLYTYSDFTGNIARSMTLQSGTYTASVKDCTEYSRFLALRWTAVLEVGQNNNLASIGVQVESARETTTNGETSSQIIDPQLPDTNGFIYLDSYSYPGFSSARNAIFDNVRYCNAGDFSNSDLQTTTLNGVTRRFYRVSGCLNISKLRATNMSGTVRANVLNVKFQLTPSSDGVGNPLLTEFRTTTQCY